MMGFSLTQPPTAESTFPRFTFNQNDQAKGIQFANGLIANYTYNGLSLVGRETLNDTAYNRARALLTLNYQYNQTGTVASVTGGSASTSGQQLAVNEQHSYDPLRRLVNSRVQSGSTNATIAYTYDSLGNWVSQTLNGIITSYTYNAASNELTGSDGPATTVYGYDLNGNLVSQNMTTPSAHWTYTWDVPGNLLKVANNGGPQGYYAYDGLGRRVEANEGSSATFYAYFGTETLAEGPTSPYTDYVYADGLRIARVTNGQTNNPIPVYFQTDALGSTRLVTSATKAVLFSDNYQPYGLDNQASGSETYKFTGKPGRSIGNR